MRMTFAGWRSTKSSLGIRGMPEDRVSKHRRIAILRDGTRLYEFNATKPRPHVVRRARRIANRRARASRKANR